MKLMDQLLGRNPFKGDIECSRVNLFDSGRSSLPFPHPWNYTEPLKILASYYCNIDQQIGSARHNRYLNVPGMPYVLVTREPAVIQAILLDTGDRPGQFDRDTRPARGIARSTGEDSLLYANGEAWRRQKKIAAAPFTRSTLFQPEKFQAFEETFRKTVAARLEQLRSFQAESGSTTSEIRLEPEIQAVMLEMLVNNFFGGSIPYHELRERYVPAVIRLIDHMVSDTVSACPMDRFMSIGARSTTLKQDRRDFEVLTDIALSGRARGLGLWEQFKSDVPDEKLRSNVKVFLAGALEATTSFASWALSHIARNPQTQEQIYQEVRDMDVYDPDDISKAQILGHALEETLRLSPALYFLPRRATQDTWITTADSRKMMIPRGTHIALDVWHANRCEDFWGESISGYPADTFAVERWQVLAQRGKRPKDILHFGFGHGPRVCPGKFLGMLEVTLLVGAFIKLFKFAAVDPRLDARAGVSTKPVDGVHLSLQIRS
jgi:cytochrome P450